MGVEESAAGTQNTLEQPSTLQPQQRYSCVLCSRRKVKCDRRVPCCHCAKLNVECVYKDPPPRRKRRNRDFVDANKQAKKLNEASSDEITLLKKRLQLCEAKLNSLGLSVPTTPGDTKNLGSDDPISQISESLATNLNLGTLKYEGRMLSIDGETRYVEDSVLANVNDEFGEGSSSDVEEEGNYGGVAERDTHFAVDQAFEHALFGVSVENGRDFILQHPSHTQIWFLWRQFLDYVNPLTKIIHRPTMESELTNALQDITNVPRDFEALLFGVYCIATCSLTDESCAEQFHKPRSALLKEFHSRCRLALIKADFLRSTSIKTLQGFFFMLVSLRVESDEPHIVWVLMGSLKRMSMRIGLHRDGSNLNLPPFETEMRRRFWIEMYRNESIAAGLSSAPKFMSNEVGDCGWAANVDDSDLYPGMTEPPTPRDTPGEMMFIQFRDEALRQFLKAGVLTPRATFKTAMWSINDKQIDELESMIQDQIIRYCDPANRLHVMTQLVARGMVTKLRIAALDNKLAMASTKMPELIEQKFPLVLRAMQYYEFLHDSKSLHGFSFHYRATFQWDQLIELLDFLRERPNRPQAGEAWRTLEAVFRVNPDILGRRHKRPLNAAVCRLALRAWELREQISEVLLTPPWFIEEMQLKRKTSSQGSSSYVSGNTPQNLDFILKDVPMEQPLPMLEGTIDFSAVQWSQWDALMSQDPMDFFAVLPETGDSSEGFSWNS